MKRRGVTIIAILLMLVVLAAVIGAMVIAGSGTIGGEFRSAGAEEARRASEAGAQAALGFLNEVGAPATPWIFAAGPGPIPWQQMANGDSEYQVYHVTGGAATLFVSPGDPAHGILPSTSPTYSSSAVAQVPGSATVHHYLLSTGRTHAGQYRQVGTLYVPGTPPTIVSQQIF